MIFQDCSMPIYEYSCQACGKQTEILQKLSDPPATDCPACGKPALSKAISAAGFRLAGGGWYETDFKTGSKKNLAGDSNAAAAASGGGESAAAAPAPACGTGACGACS
jgi:putative FmdB family regulatory protein